MIVFLLYGEPDPACSRTYVGVPCPLATRDMTGENSVRQQKKLLYRPQKSW